MILRFLPLMIILASISCKPASYTLEEYRGKKLLFANGGGFTGQVIEYTLFENGQVFRNNSMTGETREMKGLKKNIADQVFINYDFLQLDKIKLNDPGNMYFYIVMQNEDKLHKLLWNNDNKDQVDRNVLLFYKAFMNYVKE